MAIIYNIEEAVKNSYFNVLQEPINMILDQQSEAFEKKSIIPEFFVMKTSDKYREEFRSRTTMGNFKPSADLEPAGLTDFGESYNKQYTFQIWTNAFVISKQTMEDKMSGDVTPDALGFIKSYYRTRELYAVRVIGSALGHSYEDYVIKATQNGTSMDTVDGTIDGIKRQYFHNNHLSVGKTEDGQSNKFHSTLKFDGTESALEEKILDVVEQVASKMAVYTDDKGNITPVNPTKIFIAEDYMLKNALERGLKTRYGSAMAGNGVNLVYGKYTVVINPYLNAIEGFRPEQGEHGMIIQDPERNREGLGATFWDRVPLQVESYIDKRTKANIIDGRARFGAGFGDFRAMSYIDLGGKDSVNSTLVTPLINATKDVRVVNTVSTKEEA